MASGFLSRQTADWLAGHASSLDRCDDCASQLMPALAQAGLFRVGVPKALGGDGGDASDGFEAIAEVSEQSLAAGFVHWGHRTYIEYLLQSPNTALRDRLLPGLLAGEFAGATALSNAMKFLAGLEGLQIASRVEGERYVLDGSMPWVTNLRKEGFHVAAAVSRADGRGSYVASLANDLPGMTRSPDLDLIAMRGTNTAAIKVQGVEIGAEDIIAEDAQSWLPLVRPAFLGLQCGMSIGLARRTLKEARIAAGAGRSVLAPELERLAQRLNAETEALRNGLRSGIFVKQAAALFRIRIALADITADAVGFELQAGGGKCYLSQPGEHFARRWREAAFIPVITPSLVQLKSALAAQAVQGAAA